MHTAKNRVTLKVTIILGVALLNEYVKNYSILFQHLKNRISPHEIVVDKL